MNRYFLAKYTIIGSIIGVCLVGIFFTSQEDPCRSKEYIKLEKEYGKLVTKYGDLAKDYCLAIEQCKSLLILTNKMNRRIKELEQEEAKERELDELFDKDGKLPWIEEDKFPKEHFDG